MRNCLHVVQVDLEKPGTPCPGVLPSTPSCFGDIAFLLVPLGPGALSFVSSYTRKKVPYDLFRNEIRRVLASATPHEDF